MLNVMIQLKKVALSTGAGMSMIGQVKADCFFNRWYKISWCNGVKPNSHYWHKTLWKWKHFSPLLMGLIKNIWKK